MQAALLFSGGGPMVILTSHEGLDSEAFLDRLARKGIRKFIALPVPIDLVREKYGVHFEIVCRDLHETDDLRVLDFDGHRALELLPFDGLGPPVYHEWSEAGLGPIRT